MSEQRTIKWSDEKKWRMYLAGSIVTVCLSVALSYWIAIMTAEDAAKAATKELITHESDQGQLLLNGIGYRYFSSIGQVIDTSTGKFKEDPYGAYKNAYFFMLREVQEDFRWIQRNPIVFKREDIMVDISQIQLFMALELSHKKDLILGNTLGIMCRLFVNDESWKAPLEQFKDQAAIGSIRQNFAVLCNE